VVAVRGEDLEVTIWEIFQEHILANRASKDACMANFSMSIIRMGFFNLAPTF
jgi:sugar phosphate permease